MQLASDLIRPRDLVGQVSVERRVGRFFPGVEYTWRSGRGLLGARRGESQGSWLDVIESNRRRREHRLHLRLGHVWNGQTVLFHYEWVRGSDDTDGPFSFPAGQTALAEEWAPTADVSPHNVTLVANLRLPAAIAFSVIATARSTSPYNITSGVDIETNGLYTDRTARPRNSGHRPTYRSLDLFGSKRIHFPDIFRGSGRALAVDVGVQAHNLLNAKNYLTLGSVIGSPTFGQPLSALPGRAVRVWFSLGGS